MRYFLIFIVLSTLSTICMWMDRTHTALSLAGLAILSLLGVINSLLNDKAKSDSLKASRQGGRITEERKRMLNNNEEKLSVKVRNDINRIQEDAREAILNSLRDIQYLQEALQIDLGLKVNEADYYAPTRYYFSTPVGKVNIHPRIGFKRLNGVRCDDCLVVLIKCLEGTEEYLQGVQKRVDEISLPQVDWQKLPTLKRLLSK